MEADDGDPSYKSLCESIMQSKDCDAVIALLDSWFVEKQKADASLTPRELLGRHVSTKPFHTKRTGLTILHLVCELGLVKVFDYVLSLNSDRDFIDKKADDGTTALMTCNIYQGSHSQYMTKRLVGLGADCFAFRAGACANAFYMACESGNLESAQYLLRSMLDALGIDDGESVMVQQRMDEDLRGRLRLMLIRQDIKATAVHASVWLGKSDRICRWLTGPKCRWLWSVTSLDFLGCEATLMRSAPVLAIRAPTIHMPTIQYLFEIHDPPISAHDALNTYLPIALKRGTPGSAETPKLILFLYDHASRQPDFARAGPASLKAVCSAVSVTPAKAAELAGTLIAAYPQLFTLYAIAVLASQLYEHSGPTPHTTTVLVLLNWYPYTIPSQARIHAMRDQLSHDIVRQYLRQGIESCQITAEMLFAAMALEDGRSDFWSQALEFCADASARNRLTTGLRDYICSKVTSPTKVELCINHVQFLAQSSGVRMLPAALSLCKDALGLIPSLVAQSKLTFGPRTLTSLATAICAHSEVGLGLLNSVMWYSDILPTQLCVTLLGRQQMSHHRRTVFLRNLLWIYNLRVRLRERSGPIAHRRIIVKSPSLLVALPIRATNLVLAMLWQGDLEVDVSLDHAGSPSSLGHALDNVGDLGEIDPALNVELVRLGTTAL